MRIARGLADKVPEDALVESTEQRAALGQLSTTGKKVPVNRAENTKLSKIHSVGCTMYMYIGNCSIVCLSICPFIITGILVSGIPVF